MPNTPNAAVDRVKAIVQRLTPIQKILIGAGLATALVGVLLLTRTAATPPLAVLYTDLEATDASEITTSLTTRNIPYELADSGATVLVPRADVYQLRIDMASQGLPQSNDGYALLDKQGITTSEFKQQVDYQRAIEGELARTIGAIDGVDAAIVHLALSEDTVFIDKPVSTTASVLVKTRGNRELPADTVEGIRHLVASSVRGLAPADITITDGSGRQLGDDSAASSADKARADFEVGIASDLTELVGRVVGKDRVHVTVSATLNMDQISDTSEKYARPDGTQEGNDGLVTSEKDVTETYNGATPDQAGLLGPDGAPIQSSTDSAVSYDKGDNGRDFAIDRTVTTTKYASGAVQKLSVAVALDEGAVTAEQADAVAALVAAAAGVDTARGDAVVVTRLPFDTRATAELDAATKDAEAAASSSRMMGLLRTGLLALLALVGLFLAYRSVRRARQVVFETIPASDLDRMSDRQVTIIDSAAGMADPLLVPETEETMARRVVEEFTDARPEQAAQLVRTWLNEG
jgi:flagellar M-ring protein FliF